MKWFYVLIFCFGFSPLLFSQNLFSERIRKVQCSKKAVFLNKGIFYNAGAKRPAKLKALRHSYRKMKGYERIVFDFMGSLIPRIYGYMDSKKKKVYLDLFHTELSKAIKSFGDSKYVEEVKFYPISDDALSVELSLKNEVSFDIFCLKSPGRLVIDIQ